MNKQQRTAWDALIQRETARLSDADLSARVRWSTAAAGITLIHETVRFDQPARQAMLALCETFGLRQAMQDLFSGNVVNQTENRPALHVAQRMPAAVRQSTLAPELADTIESALSQAKQLARQFRAGNCKGATGKPLKHVVHLGIGGSALGPAFVVDALKGQAASPVDVHFVSHLDTTQLNRVLEHLDPSETLFVVASKSFTTQETLHNAHVARTWIAQSVGASWEKHFWAVTACPEAVSDFGVPASQVLTMQAGVGGRFSAWSVVGVSVMVALGVDVFEAFCTGAWAMDQHFLEVDFSDNLPVHHAIARLWERQLQDASSHCVVAYATALQQFVPYLQQLSMESLGKSACVDGERSHLKTGAVLWGGVGTDTQHSFHQLLMQGTETVMVDFVSLKQHETCADETSQQLHANCAAQQETLIAGTTTTEVLSAHHRIEAGRPSVLLSLEALTPATLGALMACYEHSVFVQAVLLNINAFDQFGVEHAKCLARAFIQEKENA